MMEVLEDGEVNDSGPEAESTSTYKTIQRPQQQQNFRALQKPMDSDSEDASEEIAESNSDDDGKIKPKIKRTVQKPSNPHHRVNPPTKNGNLWRSLLQEECLTENFQQVSTSRKRKHDRGAESYDFLRHQKDESLNTYIKKQKKFDHLSNSSNDSSSSNSSNKSRERKIKVAKYRNKNPRREPKILPKITTSFNTSDEEYGQKLAKNLEEENQDLIIRAVSVIGKDECLKLYTNTQNIERKGGMLTINKQRRRTPGGIFLWLLKTSNRYDEKQKREIFDGDKEKQMSAGNWNMNPPPPSPVDEIANNEKPEPNLVSQKILSSIPDRHAVASTENDDVLELDYNSDMDTF